MAAFVPGFLAPGPALLTATGPEGDKVLAGPVALAPAFFGSVGLVPLAGSAAAALVLRDGGVVSAEGLEEMEVLAATGVLSLGMEGLGDEA